MFCFGSQIPSKGVFSWMQQFFDLIKTIRLLKYVKTCLNMANESNYMYMYMSVTSPKLSVESVVVELKKIYGNMDSMNSSLLKIT